MPTNGKIFVIENNRLLGWVVCYSEKTRTGFRHIGCAYNHQGDLMSADKVTYYNRTWESFQFETILNKMKAKYEAFQEYPNGK